MAIVPNLTQSDGCPRFVAVIGRIFTKRRCTTRMCTCSFWKMERVKVPKWPIATTMSRIPRHPSCSGLVAPFLSAIGASTIEILKCLATYLTSCHPCFPKMPRNDSCCSSRVISVAFASLTVDVLFSLAVFVGVKVRCARGISSLFRIHWCIAQNSFTFSMANRRFSLFWGGLAYTVHSLVHRKGYSGPCDTKHEKSRVSSPYRLPSLCSKLCGVTAQVEAAEFTGTHK